MSIHLFSEPKGLQAEYDPLTPHTVMEETHSGLHHDVSLVTQSVCQRRTIEPTVLTPKSECVQRVSPTETCLYLHIVTFHVSVLLQSVACHRPEAPATTNMASLHR